MHMSPFGVTYFVLQCTCGPLALDAALVEMKNQKDET